MRPTVAVFRPDDDRIEEAGDLLDRLGAKPILDPMLSVEKTGKIPRNDADIVIFTSPTAIDCLPDGWSSGSSTTWAIGSKTAAALELKGIQVDRLPETESSQGILEAIGEEVGGRRVEVARSAHGTDRLIEGIQIAGAYCHESILYRLDRPEGSGHSAKRAAAGALDGALFTSSRTVEHFIKAAQDREIADAAREGLCEHTVVGVIGEPTREAAEARGIAVDVVPSEASFSRLAGDVLSSINV